MTDSSLTVDVGLGSIRKAVLDFFYRERREFPWRANRDPYPVLVSEVMLQQTRTDTVVPYFERWMERFPTAGALAAASLEDVLRVWQGLGYYARARRLHGAAREIVQAHGGMMPSDPAALETLPGVGPYTAGAVASIAFGVPAPAVDGNVRRVLARLTDTPDPSPHQLRTLAAELVDPGDPGGFNQGLMEIGARICTPRAPDCPQCPLATFCRARKLGTQETRPARRDRKPVRVEEEAVAVLMRRRPGDRSVLLRKRPERGLLGGMWELPGAPVVGPDHPAEVVLRVARGLSPVAELRGGLEPLDHTFSHKRVRYYPYLFVVRGSVAAVHPKAGRGAPRWVREGAEIQSIPLPRAQTRILAQVFATRDQPLNGSKV